MSTNALFNAVQQYLVSHCMYADDEWLLGCVEYLTSDSSKNLTERDIKNLAKEQWLLNDLKDICPGSLPPNLQRQAKTVLTDRYVVQINAAIDIGTPAYQQYLKLQKINMENVDATTKFEDKIANHRMIKLFLTDGVQEITAIEYKPMRNLTCDITPGCKILIKGPVDCRRGTILLTENNVELLGGEVSDFAETNSLAGLLSSKLGLPTLQESEHNTTIQHPINITIPTLHTQMPPPSFDSEQSSKPVARVTSLQAFNDDFDVEEIAEIEEQLDNWKIPERDQSNKRPCTDHNMEPEKKFKSDNRPEDYPDNDDDIFFNEDEDYLRQMEDEIERDFSAKIKSENFDNISTIAKNTGNDITCEKPTAGVMIPNKSWSNTLSSKIAIDVSSNLIPKGGFTANSNKVDTKKAEIIAVKRLKFPIHVTSEPYTFIKQILDLSETERAGRVFIVKAQIMKLLSKLFVGKDGWCLKCTIIDGTGALDVDFTSEVLSNLVGFTPQEMNQLKKEMASHPELRKKAVEALQNAKDKLQVLYCLIELTMLEVPKITNLIPFDQTHVDLLKKRLQSTGL
ncbi:hypothetical protein K1T71_009951 [Dendrolimus kikuchii]|uniref:Uncharacterized protein n=1 Tax=Dendrolimus kikuchii TaxID=765133 RepID=A0ACC1CT66_9NEOP|nr:hypothetical protein K1T71_009951 [Dendrolimus kikuchii]